MVVSGQSVLTFVLSNHWGGMFGRSVLAVLVVEELEFDFEKEGSCV